MDPRRIIAVFAVVLAAVAVFTGCGEEEAPPPTGAAAAEQGFLQAMVPHHQSAVEMAKVAQVEGESSFVRRLADEIVRSQTAEVGQMKRIHQRLFGSPLEPNMGGHMALGLSAEEAGMNHMGGAMMIRGKRPFDRAFVDQMVPHHQGAIRMAEAVLGRTRDPALRRLAEDVIAAQRREIREMNSFREREFGGPVPGSSPARGMGHTG